MQGLPTLPPVPPPLKDRVISPLLTLPSVFYSLQSMYHPGLKFHPELFVDCSGTWAPTSREGAHLRFSAWGCGRITD